MSALAPLVGVKRTSPVEPAPRYLVHARAHLVVGIGELARIPKLADHGPVVGPDRVRLASAVGEGVVDSDATALPTDKLRRHCVRDHHPIVHNNSHDNTRAIMTTMGMYGFWFKNPFQNAFHMIHPPRREWRRGQSYRRPLCARR